MFDILICLTHFMLHTPSLFSPISPPDTLQGYVTLSEINELYSQLGQTPKPASAPSLANASPDSEVNSSPDEDTPKSAEDEVCVVVEKGFYISSVV